ncbi:MAG TPA: hypothetical protein VM943_06645 [Pyrinomonadaceae bacterium]|nr:hypothetical protein [Pyrinomonadaceae bacterium]
MKNLLMSLPFFLAGVLLMIYNKPIAEDAMKINSKLEASWLRWGHDLWLGRVVIIFMGTGVVVFGLAMAPGFLD